MSANNPNAVSKFVGDVFLRNAGTTETRIDLGAVRGLMYAIDNSGNRVEINSDNRGTILSGATPDVTVEVEVLENKNRDLIAKLFGGTSTDVAGVLTTVTDKLIRAASSWADGEVIYIDGADQNTTLTNVKNNGVVVTGSNYKLVKDGDKVGIANVSGGAIVITGTGLTTTFQHTPAAAKELSITREFVEDKEVEVYIVAQDTAGKEFTVLMDRSRVEGKYSLAFSDPTNGGDLKGSQLTFKLQKGGTTTYHDEIL